MVFDSNGFCTVTPAPLVPAFHYYSVVIDNATHWRNNLWLFMQRILR
jgi:hypothetical protein